MQTKLEDRDWDLLLQRINSGKCTAFLGPGVCAEVYPLGAQIVQEWAQDYDYPLEDSNNLVQVAQFLAVEYDPIFPKEVLLVKWYKDAVEPDFATPDEPHSVMADLPLSIYMTTNYDDFMMQALKSRSKNPKRELCRWNEYLKGQPSIFESEPGFNPTPENPVVFHLHGHNEVPESLVLTEDDYLDFLGNISRDQDLLPLQIQKALAETSLLFIGYSLRDWAFRLLLRGLITSTDPSLRRISVAQQLPPWADSTQQLERGKNYLDKYFDRMDVRVYWGTTAAFAWELRQRWEQSGYLERSTETFDREDSVQSVAQIFLSYAREDEKEVEKLYQKLSDAGFKPWMDKYDLLPGERWKSSIKKAIQNADFFLACLSNTSVKKRGYLQKEFKDALDLWQEKLESDIYLIPVRLDDCEVPDNLRDFQWVDLFEEAGLAKLIRAIQIGMKRWSD